MVYFLATKFNGQEAFYNGKAGPGWENCVGPKAQAFPYGAELAARMAAMFNDRTVLSGLTFHVVEAA
jgi:hypothetical protein